MAWATAHELGSLMLDRALALVVLTAADESGAERFDASARRWAVRYLTGAHSPTLADLRAAISALDELPGLDAINALAVVCEHCACRSLPVRWTTLLPRETTPAPPGTPRRQ